MPTAGIDFDSLSDDELRVLNNLPAMLYHGVKSEEGVLMRMNSVPRSIAENLGADFKQQHQGSDAAADPSLATGYVNALRAEDWSRLRPEGASMSGDDYLKVWRQLSGV